MMYSEFVEMSGCNKITVVDYDNIIEPMYMSTSMSKDEFVKFITPSVKALIKSYPKVIKKMLVRDNSGYMKTPNNCWYHIRYVELLDTLEGWEGKKKYVIKNLDSNELNKLIEGGTDLYLSTGYDFDYHECVTEKRKPVTLSWFSEAV